MHVTLFDANHCPGAVMLLFEPPPPAPPTLHTGDARLCLRALAPHSEPLLRAAAGGALRCVLDTTYADPQHTFPTQEEAVQSALDALRAELFNPRALIVFGSYTIGKERLFLRAAEVAGRPVFAGAAKREVLACLDLPPADAARVTADDGATNLHVVPMALVTFKRMGELLSHYKGRFDTVIGFVPTGWTARPGQRAPRAGGGCCTRRTKGALVLYNVPYSEHSSFDELRAFLRWLRPLHVVPSVGGDTPEAAEAIVRRLTSPP